MAPLKAEPPKYRCAVCGYTSESEFGIEKHIAGKIDDSHNGLEPAEHVEPAAHEPLSLTELVRQEYGGCERVDRLADHPRWSEKRIYKELSAIVFDNHVKTFMHGEYRFIKITDDD